MSACTVTAHVESFSIRNEWPFVSVEGTGRTTVCVVVPVNTWLYVESDVSVVVPAAVTVVVNHGTKLLDVVLLVTLRVFIVAAPVERTKLNTLSMNVPASSYLRSAQSPPAFAHVSSQSTRAAHLATLLVRQENSFHTLFAAETIILPIPEVGITDTFQGTTTLFESSIVTHEFCRSLPVVPSKRVMALSVEEAGPTTSPLPHGISISHGPSRLVPFTVFMFVQLTSVSCFPAKLVFVFAGRLSILAQSASLSLLMVLNDIIFVFI